MSTRYDYRINWQMPAEPIGRLVQPPAVAAPDPIRAFETMRDEPELPNDVETRDGKPWVRCCRCKRWEPMLIDPEEHVEDEYYCGRSEWCIP